MGNDAMTNRILELVNNLVTLNRAALVIYLLLFLLVHHRGKPIDNSSIIFDDVRRHALYLAVAITIDKIGALIVGFTVAVFRAIGIGGGDGIPSSLVLPGMISGSILMGVGTLLTLRVLSVKNHGDYIWGGTAALTALYGAAGLLKMIL